MDRVAPRWYCVFEGKDQMQVTDLSRTMWQVLPPEVQGKMGLDPIWMPTPPGKEADGPFGDIKEIRLVCVNLPTPEQFNLILGFIKGFAAARRIEPEYRQPKDFCG